MLQTCKIYNVTPNTTARYNLILKGTSGGN
jgi:hypothetical protein